MFAETTREELLAQDEAFQAELRDCLARKGFDYEPEPVSDFALATVSASPEEFAAQYGYGIAASLLTSINADETSPNIANQTELTAQERDAMSVAMTGPGGCIEKSQPTGVDRSVLLLDETIELLREADARIAADERTVEAMAVWASCMSERGYSFATRDDAVSQAQDALNNWMSDDDASDPNDEAFDETRRSSLEALVDEESRIASDDLECAKPVQAILDNVTAEYMDPVEQQIDAMAN